MSFLDLVERIMDAVKPAVRFYGFYLYEVGKDDGDRTTLRRVGDAGGNPDLPGMINKLYGSHGITCVSTEASQVLVGFEGGNPARPFVAFYVPKNPVSMLIDADQTIQIMTTPGTGIHGPGGGTKQVYVGSKERHKVARKDDPVYVGELQFVGGPGSLQIIQSYHDGSTRVIGTLVGTGLVFTPDLGSFGVALLDGHISGGSELFSSE